MKILITGGAGFIGSHTCVELIDAGYEVIIADNLSNSSIKSIYAIEKIIRRKVIFYNIDIRNKILLEEVFNKHKIDGVIHFAGYKAVGESVIRPIQYYDNNINGTLVLCEVMKDFGCFNLIFSSSASVYSETNNLPINESASLSTSNPYGRSKLIIENILEDLFVANAFWNITILRYFNPVGAHKSGLIGDSPLNEPNNLMPYISQVAIGKLDILKVFGDDYDTSDGTGVRDYIHVVDLAQGHVKALKVLQGKPQVLKVNLGTGIGYSVLDIIKAFELASGMEILYEIVERRPGDIGEYYADASLAAKVLDWKANYNLHKMCEDSWHFQSKYPNGY